MPPRITGKRTLLIAVLAFFYYSGVSDDPSGHYVTVFTRNCLDENRINPCDTLVNNLTLDNDGTFMVVYNDIDTTKGRWTTSEVNGKILVHFVGKTKYPSDTLIVTESSDASRDASQKKLIFTDTNGKPLDELRVSISHDSVSIDDAEPEIGELTVETETTYPIRIRINPSGFYSGNFSYKVKNNKNNLFIFHVRRHKKELFINENWVYRQNKLFPEYFEEDFESEDYYLEKAK